MTICSFGNSSRSRRLRYRLAGIESGNAGIHFRTAIQAGDRLGRRIGRFASEHVLQPLRCCTSRDDR